MKITNLRGKCFLFQITGLIASAFLLQAISLNAQETNAPQESETAAVSEADKAWAETELALKSPVPPAEWRERRPTNEEIEQFREQQSRLAVVGADRARAFYETYPDHEKADYARERELKLVQVAVKLGNTNASVRLEELEEIRLNDPGLPEEDRFQLRVTAMRRSALAKGGEDRDLIMAALEEGVRELIKDFPNRDEPYQMLLSLVQSMDVEKSKAVAQEVLDGNGSDQVKESARGLLRKFDALGKPLDIKFTAVDGREVSLADMKGKVVLVDFWATWCGPCVAELPKVRAAYDSLHPKGLEIVGISFDEDKDKLESFIDKEHMAWPQYFDGKGWENELGRQYGINSIPTMWLVDKTGNLVDMNARNNLQDRIEKLLAE